MLKMVGCTLISITAMAHWLEYNEQIPGRKPGFVKTYETNQISCCQFSQVAPALLITAEVRSTSAGEIEFVIKLKSKTSVRICVFSK